MDLETTTTALKAVTDKDYSAFKDAIKDAMIANIKSKKDALYSDCRAQLKDRENLYNKDSENKEGE